MIGIGRALGIEVVAEGVETAGQCEVLCRAGCDTAQGWLFARPMAPAALEAWLAQRADQSA
jgi:c-di-GMP-specific phosphodiesterase